MAGYKVNGDLLAQGINCIVRVDLDDESGSSPIEIGFVSEATIRKAINVQRAECIGEIRTVSIDPTGIQVTVDLRGFVPTKALVKEGIESVRGGGKIHLKSFNPDETRILDARVLTKIPYLDLYDERHQCIIGYCEWLTPTNYTDSINGKGYVNASCTLEGTGYDNGTDYPGAI
jgi:hypothetical protein